MSPAASILSTDVSERTWHDRIAERLLAELKAKPNYAQFRMIGIDDDRPRNHPRRSLGPEWHRSARPCHGIEAQRRTPLFQGHDRIAASEDIRFGARSQPGQRRRRDAYEPTLRIAAPLHAPSGKPFGIVMVNVDMRPALDRVRSPYGKAKGSTSSTSRGDYLVHPDPAREFGSELGTPIDWREDFPYLASFAGTMTRASRRGTGSDRTADGVALAPAPSGRQGMGRDYRDRSERHHYGARGLDPEHLLLVGLIAVLFAAALAVADRAIADATDRATNRGGRRHHARRRGSHSGQGRRRDRRVGTSVCPDGCGIDREDTRTAARGGRTSSHRSRPCPPRGARTPVQRGSRILQRRHHHPIA